ncbi:MAG: 5-(carboxyamino)imidazole ribonucleotide mutase, partial [Elusimicrobiota bacterium]|nr:5-(carboxyamino)imidazole ribonucleotide mutase [Elusimicrobiota bacterium]
MQKREVAIIIGSESDIETAKETIAILKRFNLTFSLNIASAHRTVGHLKRCIYRACENGAKVFIAIAGMSAALPGAIAGQTILPVIGVPVVGGGLANFDSLFSIVQMPKGVPVAAVAVGKAGAINAALLAAQIIALGNAELTQKLLDFRRNLEQEIIEKDRMLGLEFS